MILRILGGFDEQRFSMGQYMEPRTERLSKNVIRPSVRPKRCICDDAEMLNFSAEATTSLRPSNLVKTYIDNGL